jgi:hypothetical protein
VTPTGLRGRPIAECAELFGADKTHSALLTMEHRREDAANKAQVLEWIDERRREGDLSAEHAAELVKFLSTRQMPLKPEVETTSTVREVDVPSTNRVFRHGFPVRRK